MGSHPVYADEALRREKTPRESNNSADIACTGSTNEARGLNDKGARDCARYYKQSAQARGVKRLLVGWWAGPAAGHGTVTRARENGPTDKGQ